MAELPDSPLGPADLKEMNEQLDALKRADEIADRAMRAGIDVSAEKARIQESRTKINKIKQQFFPGR